MKRWIVVLGWWFLFQGEHSSQLVGPFPSRSICDTVRVTLKRDIMRSVSFERYAHVGEWCVWDGV